MEIIAIAIVTFALNLPLGMWRRRYKKLTLPWWLLVHASIPFVVALRIWLGTPHIYAVLFIAVAVAGQVIGSRYLGKKYSANRR